MDHKLIVTGLTVLSVALTACRGQQPPTATSQVGRTQGSQQTAGTVGPPLATKNMPPVAGQQKTCAGPREKTFDLDVIETTGVELGMGMTFAAWAYNGHLPGPSPSVRAAYAIDRPKTSAGAVDGAAPVDAQNAPTSRLENRTERGFPHRPPPFLLLAEEDRRKIKGKNGPTTTVQIYAVSDERRHSAGPVTDLHIKSGIHGAMIVYPRTEPLRPAREIVVVEDAVYGTPDAHGHIPGTDPARTAKNDQLFSMFNGRLDNEAVRVNPGDLVPMYFVNVGPWTSAAHVIGSVFDRVYAGAPPVQGVQTFAVPAGSGAILEFYIPEAGVFPFVDHDKLAFLPFGLALAFSTEGGVTSVH